MSIVLSKCLKRKGTRVALAKGLKAPNFTLMSSEATKVSLASFRGQNVVLYFYPQDHTETCTLQACDIRDNMHRISAAGAAVLGVSPDSIESHSKFRTDYNLPFHLLADEKRKVCELYEVWQQKTMFGRTYMGVIRSTYIIDTKGIIRMVFERVRLKGHIDAVINELQKISK